MLPQEVITYLSMLAVPFSTWKATGKALTAYQNKLPFCGNAQVTSVLVVVVCVLTGWHCVTMQSAADTVDIADTARQLLRPATSAAYTPVTYCHIPEGWSPQSHHWESLKKDWPLQWYLISSAMTPLMLTAMGRETKHFVQCPAGRATGLFHRCCNITSLHSKSCSSSQHLVSYVVLLRCTECPLIYYSSGTVTVVFHYSFSQLKVPSSTTINILQLQNFLREKRSQNLERLGTTDTLHTVKPQFYLHTFCVLHNLTNFLYDPT